MYNVKYVIRTLKTIQKARILINSTLLLCIYVFIFLFLDEIDYCALQIQ